MIPKILHRMWLDKSITNNNYAPKKYDPFIKSFKDHNPDFQVMFWNMERVNQLFDRNPQIAKYKNIWTNLPHHIQKCDMARFIIIYLYGGVYVDLDFMCFKNLSPLLNRELLLVFEPPEHSEIWNDPVPARLYNGFIGSVPRHPFWLDWLDFIVESLKKSNDVMLTTGPLNFAIFFRQSRYHNIPTINTCDLLPIYLKDNSNYITRNCVDRNHGSNIIKNNDYYKHFGNYTHTKWSEGSGWGNEQLEDPNKLKENFSSTSSSNDTLCYILIIVVILLVLILIYVYYLVQQSKKF
ncbi:glycosyl transferase [Tupanvirus deep ocean]|uniref:Glycosyl transferase n=2 Tax=Tupanvirus TaxID=2094720 RepID=A0AC62AA11_9VIRU|nr:glycosyl transferase [Tupanvirus deep ocean]QKU34463.1 glycosyl transferase [Tupanvirus deep ocean]